MFVLRNPNPNCIIPSHGKFQFMDKRGLEIETYVLTQSGTQIMSISDAAYGLGRNTIQIEKNTQRV